MEVINLFRRAACFSLFLLFGCVAEKPATGWTPWQKYNDSPGLMYRTNCAGQVYRGSRFYKWAVEVKNTYNVCSGFEISLSNPDGYIVSESYRLQVIPGNVKKVTFYNVRLNSSNAHSVKLRDIHLL
jgi:hypothetical protein